MKQKRHEKILELVARYPVDTQEELLRLLREDGFDVTQATVSRDIKELRLLKVLAEDGKYRYAPAKEEARESALKFYSIFAESVLSVDCVRNIICVKCMSGVASAMCAAFDSLHWNDAVGTLAGDDTIFILMRSDEAAEDLAGQLKKNIG